MLRISGATILLLLLVATVLPAGAEEGQWILMITDWKVKRVADMGDLGDSFFRPDFDDSDWERASIEADPPYTDRFILYRSWVKVSAAWKGKMSISFMGVDDDAVVYLNGEEVGQHQGSEEGFAFDVTDLIQIGGKNLIAVLCDNSGGGPAGVYGSVSLILVEEMEKAKAREEAKLRARLKEIKYKIVYETYRDNNWELYMCNADGSDPVNLTNTPDVNEMYPQASPDGAKISFVVDEGEGEAKIRNVYYMNTVRSLSQFMDGTGRIKVAENARQPCWSSDSTAIAYLKGEFDKFSYLDYATRGIFIYNLETGKHTEHPNKELYHLYNPSWSPDSNWFASTVHGGMGYDHAILAIEAKGNGVFNLEISGCRPDISPDGKKVAWGRTDWDLSVGDLELTLPKPKVTNRRDVFKSSKPMKIYHIDWSPDGEFFAFSRGPIKEKSLGYAQEIVGIQAGGWNICVGDTNGNWIAITADGLSNKEPDWVQVK